MAAATTGASALVSASVAPPPSGATSGAGPAAVAVPPTTPVKPMQQLLNEIDQAKIDVEATTKRLEKIDTGRKKAELNRDSSVEGRTQIKDLTERVNNLQKQMETITKQTDPTYRASIFDKTKRNALKTLKSLSEKLTHADKHLEKATGTVPATVSSSPAPPVTTSATPAANAQPVTTTPAVAATDGTSSKGVGGFIGRLPFVRGRKKREPSPQPPVTTAQATAPPVPAVEAKSDAKKEIAEADVVSSGGEEEGESGDDDIVSDDDDVVTDKKKEIRKSPRPAIKAAPIVAERKPSKVPSVDSEDDSDYDDDDDVADSRQLVNALETKASLDDDPKDLGSTGRRSRTPTTPHDSKKAPVIKTEASAAKATTTSLSPTRKKVPTASPPPPVARKKPPSPRRRAEVPAEASGDESDEGTYFEEDEEEEEEGDEDELRRLRDSGDHEEAESDHDVPEEDEGTTVNAYVQELRAGKYAPGTQFYVTNKLAAAQPDDLTLNKGDMLTLVEQHPDGWWLMRNNQTQQQGMVPINHIRLVSEQQVQRQRRTAKIPASTTTLVDVFKANNNMPAGFIPSELAPLTQFDEYQLSRVLVPIMTESNLAYADLHWRVDEDRIYEQRVTHQKIFILKDCIKVPRIKGEQVRVLDRSVRVCLYDGFEIISNIHTVRAHIPKKIDERELTEDWHFKSNDANTFIAEQPNLLIRSKKLDGSRHLYLLIELSQWCQSTVTQEKCEVGCGWTKIQLDEQELPLITDTKSYNELLHGGHQDEPNVLLHPDYKILKSAGISGKIDRLKRARIKFSIESRDDDLDTLFDNLPTEPLIVPMNLCRILGFYRHELAYQLHQRQHPTGLSTTPIDSIFLSTFFQTLTQPDLLDALHRIYRARKRHLSSSASRQQLRREFIKTYEIYIYPLLNYRQLPPYDFHDLPALTERRRLIDDLNKRRPPTDKTPTDILSILLDKDLTDKWSPFTTQETCFSLQNYAHQFTPETVT